MAAILLPRWRDTDEEYAAVERVERLGGIPAPRTVETIRSRAEALRSVGCIASHRLATRGDAAIGFVGFSQLPTAVNDDVFVARIVVVPDERRRGVGSALHAAMLASAEDNGIRIVLAYVDERLEGTAFARSHGYRDRGSYIESSVDPSDVDSATIAGAINTAERAGLRFERLADLIMHADSFDRFYELYTTVSADAPFPIEERPASRDVVRARFFDSNEAMPEATFVAVDRRDTWVGLTELRRAGDAGDRVTQDITGVLRSHRRRGIATALKATSLEYARSVGITRITAWNDEANTGMRAINDRFGFAVSHAIRRMTLDLTSRATAPVPTTRTDGST